MSKFYIVWNAKRNEGFITDDLKDAKQALRGKFSNNSSALGEAFCSCYDDDDRGFQTVDIEPIPEA
jgi:hypothetical protein